MLSIILRSLGLSLILGIGLYILVKSSDLFVESASKLARRIGVKESLIGLTIVAVGTSFPELIASIVAATTGSTDLIVGNILGSNIANHGLILGAVAIFAPYTLKKHLFARESLIVVGLAIGVLALMWIGGITAAMGLVLLSLYILYTIYEIHTHQREGRALEELEEVELRGTGVQDTTILILSFLGLWLGGELAVRNAIELSRMIGLSEIVIAATVIAIGTSLPELSVCITAARAGKGELVAGNVLGSSIANVLLVFGVASLITPITFSALSLLLVIAWLVLALMTAWYVHKREIITKKHGAILFAVFALVSLLQILW